MFDRLPGSWECVFPVFWISGPGSGTPIGFVALLKCEYGMELVMNLRIAWLVLGMSGAANLLASDPDSAMRAAPVEYGQPADLPKPSSLSVNAFEERLFDFVNRRQYAELGWKVDKSVRDTGPFVDGKYYGTHPAVRIYYSPEVVRWLVGGRQTTIPDGAMIVKEQYHPPAARYEGMDEDQLWDALESWTIMVKDSAGSHDGWFWSNPAKNQQVVDYYSYPFEEPYSGFGLYCVRCHASTTSPGPTQEYTFASLRNIEGFPGEPLLFRVDDSWRDEDEDLANEHKLADLASRPPEEGRSSVHPSPADRSRAPKMYRKRFSASLYSTSQSRICRALSRSGRAASE